MDPITVAKLWMVVKPFKRWKEHRQAKREGREPVVEKVIVTLPSGEQIERVEPSIPLRTATKATIGSALVAYPGYQVVEFVQSIEFPWPWLENFTNGPAFVWLCATIIPIIISRLTKSPAVPGNL